jgi:NAD(P)-dependent dehydrogenase (short-subunit alcohol dehydrogenase family)
MNALGIGAAIAAAFARHGAAVAHSGRKARRDLRDEQTRS